VKSISLLAAIVLGIFIPEAGRFSFLVRGLLMVMLFLGFWQIRFKELRWQKAFTPLLIAQLLWPLVVYAGVLWWAPAHAALAWWMIAISPMATAAPAVVRFLGGNMAHTLVVAFASNLLIPLYIVLWVPWLGVSADLSVFAVAAPVLLTLLLPLAAAWLFQRPFLADNFVVYKIRWLAEHNLGFGVWLLAIFLVVARAADFLQGQPVRLWLWPALGAGVLCVLQFYLGAHFLHYFTGSHSKEQKVLAAHALGQKNTILTIWISLTWFSPEVALGPVAYVIWQNLWIAFKLSRRTKVLGTKL
jgi:BASS family bile acid:Na+ symporter